MYLIVVGAEAEGSRLIDLAVEKGHEVTLVENNEDKARRILKKHSIRVLRGDVADDQILQEAEIGRADAVIAATYDDSKNLMAMMLAKEADIQTCISLVNQPSHQQMFERLEVRVVSDPAGIVANNIYQQLD